MADLRMPDINRVQLAGNLTRDPELKYIPSGTALCDMSIAVSRKFKTKTGETREETMYVEVALWGPAAEWISKDCKKGSPVYLEGRLKMDSWDDKSTGQKRSKLTVVADRVQQLSWNDRGGFSGGGGGGGHSERPQPRDIEEPIPEDDIPF